jgi:hypothetical protein
MDEVVWIKNDKISTKKPVAFVSTDNSMIRYTKTIAKARKDRASNFVTKGIIPIAIARKIICVA